MYLQQLVFVLFTIPSAFGSRSPVRLPKARQATRSMANNLTQASQEGSCFSYGQDTDCVVARDLASFPSSDFGYCCGLCKNDPDCQHFTQSEYNQYGEMEGTCFLKASCVLTPNSVATSGSVSAISQTTSNGSCLCVFDIDRTLTGKQGDVTTCPNNQVQDGVYDDGYGGGTLTLSQVAVNYGGSFCGQCYVGLVSVGSAAGWNSQERDVLLRMLNVTGKVLTTEWAYGGEATTPFVTNWPDGEKQYAVRSILMWYEERGIYVADQDVYFFDDKASNVQPFQGTAFNARQISCDTRDYNGNIGYCGATTQEVSGALGVIFC